LASWGNALAVVAACGVGAFIDFYIGESGQQRVRDWLQAWWVRFSDVRWGNLGREEAVFAVKAMDRLFGRRLFSVKRVILAALLTTFILSILIIITAFSNDVVFVALFRLRDDDDVLLVRILMIVVLGSSLVALAISFSFTRFFAEAVGQILTKVPFLNVIGVVSIVILQYIVLCGYLITTVQAYERLVMSGELTHSINRLEESIKYSPKFKQFIEVEVVYYKEIVSLIGHNFYDYPILLFNFVRDDGIHYLGDGVIFLWYFSTFISLIPPFIRVSIMTIFIMAFCLKPLRDPIMTLWARVIESDKPVFTLLLGGTAALAKAIQEIAGALW